MTNEKRRMDWERLVSDYRASELSMRAWCEKSGVTFYQLRYWMRKQAVAGESCGWSAVEVVEDGYAAPVNETRSMITVRVGSAAIDVHPGFDESLLSDVLTVVARVC